MAAAAAPGSVLTDRMVLPKPELLRNAIYNEGFRPQGLHAVMTATVIREPPRSGVIVLFRRPEGDRGGVDRAPRSRPGPRDG